jgi:hypothetical protein
VKWKLAGGLRGWSHRETSETGVLDNTDVIVNLEERVAVEFVFGFGAQGM